MKYTIGVILIWILMSCDSKSVGPKDSSEWVFHSTEKIKMNTKTGKSYMYFYGQWRPMIDLDGDEAKRANEHYFKLKQSDQQ